MSIARSLTIVALGLALAQLGCIMPHRSYSPGASATAANGKRGAEQAGVETLIRVDHEGNVYRGGDATAPRAADDRTKATPPSVRRTAAKESAPAEFSELASAIDEPQVDAARVAELVAAHERGPTPKAESATPKTPSTVVAAAQPVVAVNESPPEPATPKVDPLPAGVFPTVVRSTRFELEYDDQVLGEGGIAKVELYGTRDAGRTWEKLGEDDDRASPYLVEMPEEGVFGFRIAVAGKNGLASRPPQDGELPELWVRVDLSEPMFRANLRPACEAVGATPVSDTNAGDMLASAAKPTIEQSPKNAASQASHTVDAQPPVAPADWQSHLTEAIVAAERALAVQSGDENSATDAEKEELSCHLRLLYLAAGRHEDAIKNSPQHDAQQNEFWGHQMHAINLLVEPASGPAARRASAALAELHDAADQLGAQSELAVNNLTFCTSASSFGVYETAIEGTTWKHGDYAQRKFEPEQPIVLYFEVANFASEQTTSREFPDGAWRTSLRGSYTIVDASGSPVEQRELKLKDDICRNRRNDYYVAYKSWIPKLNPGQYSLELLVEDTIAGKIGTSSIDFEVVAE